MVQFNFKGGIATGKDKDKDKDKKIDFSKIYGYHGGHGGKGYEPSPYIINMLVTESKKREKKNVY